MSLLDETLRPRPGAVMRRRVIEVSGGASRSRPDTVVTEEPLEIRLSWPGQPAVRVSVTMRTPGADFELAAGYLLSEGVLGAAQQPSSVAYCVDPTLSPEQRYNVVTVDLPAPPRRMPSSRTATMTSACGVCGVESIADVIGPESEPVAVDDTVDTAVVASLPDALRTRQRLFDRTGAIHASGVFDFDGSLVVVREDVGRHNTVDKVLGARALGNAAFGESSALCVSGRLGFDIVAKAVAGRIGLVVAVGGPSSLAVELAERAGVTLCGFTRGDRFVVYTCPERIVGV